MKKMHKDDHDDALSSEVDRDARSEHDTKIVIADHANQPAITIQTSQDFAAYKAAEKKESLDSTVGRLGSMLQAAPTVLAAGEMHGKQLMEVVVNGNLVRATDGNGFRAYTMGAKGVREQARLFTPEKLQNMVNAGAVWQVASVIVAQKHLADISKKLTAIADGVKGLSNFMDDHRRSQIEGAYRYLDQARIAIEAGEIPSSVRAELEHCERDLLSIETHLHKEIMRGIATTVPHEEAIGTEDLAMGISRKIRKQEALLRDLALCIRTRICAWHVLVLFPGEPKLKEARRRDLQRAVKDFATLSPTFDQALRREIQNIDSTFNLESTLKRRRDALTKQVQDTLLKIENTQAAADRLISDTEALLIRHDAPVRLLLQYTDGVLEGVRQTA